MSEIIWHQLPKDLIKVICKYAEDVKPSALSIFLANSDKIDWEMLSRDPMSFLSNDTPNVWHWQTLPTIDELIASNAIDIRINWDLLPRNTMFQDYEQIKPVQTKHDALLMRLALLMRVRF